MYELLLPLIVVLLIVVKTRERFFLRVDPAATVPVKTDPNDSIPTSWENGRTLYTTDPNANVQGQHVVGTWPDSCGEGKEYQGGLCYDRCKPGYNGILDRCWNDFIVRAPKPIGLRPCPHGWTNDGLTCREPLRWDSCKFKGLFGECWGGLRGGRVEGRLNGGGICDWPQDRGNLPDWLVDKSDPKNYKATHPVRIGGLCYKECPKSHPHTKPAAIGACYADDGPISYSRGVGKIPCTLRLFGWCAFGGNE